ncbi:hypothetical protein [Comamonas testosteroni]|uniref:hypothetical protein n=1 Tax=Comamonas testosteroni TaxID=285 RepID=UPI0028EEA8E3|nr:hypothetical protein [Comamonas testosteroni]
MDTEICHLYSQERTRRLAIFRRADGTYGWEEQYHYENALANTEGWAQLPAEASRFHDLEAAKREAAVSVPWVADGRGFIDVAEPR